MIMLGRVYEGLMVDVQAVNKKLVRRSETMLQRLTGRNREDVRAALRKADGSVKLAVLLLQGCNPDEATTILDRAGGRLRTALAAIGRESALKNAPEIASPPMHDSLIDD
jgi:N-acetylmuramic acid 6-phosphate etherase